MSKFKVTLKRKLEKQNISQNQFAKMIGVSPVYIGQLIKGNKEPPSRDLQIKMADILYKKEKEKNNFLDNIAKEKEDIPSDIYKGIFCNKNKWGRIREILKQEKIIE